MDRELTYQLPYKRLSKLGRSAGRKAYRGVWLATWGWLGGMAAAYFLMLYFRGFEALAAKTGLHEGALILTWGIIFFAGLFALRKWGRGQVKTRADFDSTISFRKLSDGLRFATHEIEYLVKWSGISQILREPDGVVVSHGSLFFLIPDSTFLDEGERNALVRDVYARLGPEAKTRSLDAVKTMTGDETIEG